MLPLTFASALTGLIGAVSRPSPSFGSPATSSKKPTLTTPPPPHFPSQSYSLVPSSKGFLWASLITLITLPKVSVHTTLLLLPLLDSLLMAESVFTPSFLHLLMHSARNTYYSSTWSREFIGRYKVNKDRCLWGVSFHYYGRSRRLNLIEVCADWSQTFRLGVERGGSKNIGRGLEMLWSKPCLHLDCKLQFWWLACRADVGSDGQWVCKVAGKSYVMTAGAAPATQ